MHSHFRLRFQSMSSIVHDRDAGTTSPAGAVGFHTHNFMGALRVHKGGAMGAQENFVTSTFYRHGILM